MKRMLACLFIVAALPAMSPPSRYWLTTAHPFATEALAGHSVSGTRAEECTCPLSPDGTCPCCGFNGNPMNAQYDVEAVVQHGLPARPDSNSDLGPGALLLLFAFIAWSEILA